MYIVMALPIETASCHATFPYESNIISFHSLLQRDPQAETVPCRENLCDRNE